MSELVVSSTVSVTGSALSSILELAGAACSALVALADENVVLVPAEVRASLRAQAEQSRRRLLVGLPASQGGTDGADVSEVRRAMELLARAGGTAAALRSNAALESIARERSTPDVSAGAAALGRARDAWRGGEVAEAAELARVAQAHLERALEDSFERLATAHHQHLVASVGSSLTEMGYEVAQAATESGAGFWATSGPRVIGVAVLEDGTLITDIAGCEGGRCELEASRLFAALRTRGIDIRREAVLRHLRRDGGQLIQAARRTGRGATGVVEAASRVSRAPKRRTSQRAVPGPESDDGRFRRDALWLWQRGGSR